MRSRLLAAVALTGLGWCAVPALAADAGSLTVDIPIGAYTVTPTDAGHEISLEGFGRTPLPGAPALPARIFAIAVPPGAQVTGIEVELGAPVELPGSYNIAPVTLHRVIGEESPLLRAQELKRYQQTHDAIYGSDALFPANVTELVRTAHYRRYDLVDVRVTPFQYEPSTGTLLHYPDLSVVVNYDEPADDHQPIVDGLASTEKIASDLILNYNATKAWYGAPALQRGLHDFVIVTLDSLTGAVTPLVDWETSKGRNVEVVTTTWIDSNYTGYDLSEKIRNFLREKYPSGVWGIEDVLLVGDYDDVPIRNTWQDLGYGNPETDYYFAELSLPDSQSWDANGNHRWGEDSDPVDFYVEVNVGRIPWSEVSTVQSICQKSVAYEMNTDPTFKKNMLLLGGYFWADTDNAYMMEAKVDQPWMSDWTLTRMYEQNSDYYSSWPCDQQLLHANVMSTWPTGKFAFVNWAGHGSPTSSHIYGLGAPAFITAYDCPDLNDDYPSIVFADACSNSDTHYTNIGKAMIKQGSIGFVGATNVALGCPGWRDVNDGSSQSMDYLFTTYVTSTDYTQGQAHQAALRYMYTHGLWGYNRYEMFQWGALWGNPDLGMGFVPPLALRLQSDIPNLLGPGETLDVTLQISDGMEQYLPGSGMLCCRYDGGVYVTDALTPLGGDLYQVTLPAVSCDDVPEFYFSAEGDQGSVLTLPYGAPADVFSFDIGTITVVMADDFEADLGWTTAGDCSVGMWERGVPVGGGDRGDPANDYDGSGQCYLTANFDDDSDVDGGTAYLMSPTIDLSTGDADIHYALWYSNNFGGDPNNDLFRTWVSNDNGANWSLVETIGPNSPSGWNMHSFTVGDVLTPNGQVKVRFEVSDLGSGSVVEAGIDAFQVDRFDCTDIDCPEDLDGDGAVGQSDLGILLSAYELTDAGDIDGDGDTDQADLGALLARYGEDC
jgi:Peptidase family C25/Propeptide_C25